jgi:phosphotriesterase-related protein
MSALTVEELTAIVVADVTTGAQGTGVRAGIIGEVGIQGRPLVDNEIKSIRASARAARITGAPLSLHSFAAPEEMLEALDIIESEGVALSRVVMSHTGGPLSDYLTELFGRGVFVEWDYMGQAPLGAERDAQIAATIKAAIDAGHLRQILLSHDICTAPQLAKNGGGGYTYISERIVPALASLGVTPAEIETLLVDNPRRALTFVAPAAR